MDTVVTSTDSSTGNMVITWTAPSSNGGRTVTAYSVQVLEYGTTSTYADMTSCDGTDSSIISALSCSVPMTELVDDHSYVLGATPKIRAAAINSLGTAEYSDDNTSGAVMTTLPTQMADPTYATLTKTTVTINWTSLTANADIGGTAITSYNLYWDNGTGSTTISL